MKEQEYHGLKDRLTEDYLRTVDVDKQLNYLPLEIVAKL